MSKRLAQKSSLSLFCFISILSIRIVHSGGEGCPSSGTWAFSNDSSSSDICVKCVDMFDNSVYVGSSCFVDVSVSWEDAKNFCESNQMLLLRVLSTAIEFSIFQTAKEIYGTYTGQKIWLNARKNNEGIWISYENSTETVLREYSRLLWMDQDSQAAGDCLMITNQAGPFRFSGNSCFDQAPFICSYMK